MARTKKRQKELNKQRRKRKSEPATGYNSRGFVRWPESPEKGIPSIDVDKSLRAIANKDQGLWYDFLHFIHYFELHHYMQYGNDAIRQLNDFCFLYSMACSREDYLPTPDIAGRFAQVGHIIQSLYASCSHKTTDTALDACMGIQNNVGKMMSLLNPRSEIQLDQKLLFDVDPKLASVWYMAYMLGISSPTRNIQKNLYRHLELMDERFVPPHHSLSGLYFGCTYHNQNAVRRVKSIINKSIKAAREQPPFENNPDPKSIAVITERWHRNHAVYKSQSPLLEQLKGEYKLTLIWTNPPGTEPPTMVKDYFDKVVHCYFKPGGELVIPDELLKNDFQMVYFPDVGMSDESIWLSNFRMAPIQAVGYGHPDTTGDGNEIDYFICGQVEKEADYAYSETRVCIPGLAQEPAWPSVDRQNNYIDDGVVRINCVWGPDKYNHTLLTVLAEINKQVLKIKPDTNHEFHLFGSPGLNRYGALPPFIRDVRTLLPNARVHSQWEYYDYMREAEKHDFALNSFPFGCYNVLVESLWMGIPFLSLVGDRFYNRAGMWLNEKVGMEENNFESPQALIAKATELITNPGMLKQQRDHLASIDLKERLFTLKGSHFKQAIDYIIANHPFTETVCIGENE